MSWNDGISKQLNEYLESIGVVTSKATEAIKEQVDIEVEIVFQELFRTAPRDTGELVASLTKAQITTRKNWYGHSIEFVGSNSQGVAYQKIANILNYGSSKIQGTRFISRAIRKFKGMDNRIAERFEKNTKLE
jgi:uncharacterized protein YoaH (UPF0181 family)